MAIAAVIATGIPQGPAGSPRAPHDTSPTRRRRPHEGPCPLQPRHRGPTHPHRRRATRDPTDSPQADPTRVRWFSPKACREAPHRPVRLPHRPMGPGGARHEPPPPPHGAGGAPREAPSPPRGPDGAPGKLRHHPRKDPTACVEWPRRRAVTCCWRVVAENPAVAGAIHDQMWGWRFLGSRLPQGTAGRRFRPGQISAKAPRGIDSAATFGTRRARCGELSVARANVGATTRRKGPGS